MLKIINFVDKRIGMVEVDPYIPFKVQFSADFNPFVNLWRIINNNCLFEIAVDSKTGIMNYVTLVNIEQNKIMVVNGSFVINVQEIEGTPICDLKIWKHNDCVDVEKEVRLIIGENYLRFLILNEKNKHYYRIKRTLIGVNENKEFCEIAIIDLLKQEVDVLCECLRIKK